MEQEQALQQRYKYVATKPHVDAIASLSSLAALRGGLSLDNSSDDENNGTRERLKRHCSQEAGRVVVPDKWSQEEMLKDWLDFGSFDALLAPKGFDLARAALVAERRQQANKEAMESGNSKGYMGMHLSATRCS